MKDFERKLKNFFLKKEYRDFDPAENLESTVYGPPTGRVRLPEDRRDFDPRRNEARMLYGPPSVLSRPTADRRGFSPVGKPERAVNAPPSFFTRPSPDDDLDFAPQNNAATDLYGPPPFEDYELTVRRKSGTDPKLSEEDTLH